MVLLYSITLTLLAAADIYGFLEEACDLVRCGRGANDHDETAGTYGYSRLKCDYCNRCLCIYQATYSLLILCLASLKIILNNNV